jgi:hypothetical protein
MTFFCYRRPLLKTILGTLWMAFSRQVVTITAHVGLLAALLLPEVSLGQDAPAPTESKPGVPATEQLSPKRQCPLGTGLRRETAPIILKYRDHPGIVMAPSSQLAAEVFPKLNGWMRVLGAPSLAELKQKAQVGQKKGIPYEALGYGLETGRRTPQEEWHNLVGSTRQARDLADRVGKQLLMGPGFRLMSQNEDKYAPMGALSHTWVFQTQRFQIDPPGEKYRKNVAAVVKQIRAGNPKIVIWAQIVFPPTREPNVEEWLAYRACITDLVDGTYIGAYTWREYGQQLPRAIESIFAKVYDEKAK